MADNAFGQSPFVGGPGNRIVDEPPAGPVGFPQPQKPKKPVTGQAGPQITEAPAPSFFDHLKSHVETGTEMGRMGLNKLATMFGWDKELGFHGAGRRAAQNIATDVVAPVAAAKINVHTDPYKDAKYLFEDPTELSATPEGGTAPRTPGGTMPEERDPNAGTDYRERPNVPAGYVAPKPTSYGQLTGMEGLPGSENAQGQRTGQIGGEQFQFTPVKDGGGSSDTAYHEASVGHNGVGAVRNPYTGPAGEVPNVFSHNPEMQKAFGDLVTNLRPVQAVQWQNAQNRNAQEALTAQINQMMGLQHLGAQPHQQALEDVKALQQAIEFTVDPVQRKQLTDQLNQAVAKLGYGQGQASKTPPTTTPEAKPKQGLVESFGRAVAPALAATTVGSKTPGPWWLKLLAGGAAAVGTDYGASHLFPTDKEPNTLGQLGGYAAGLFTPHLGKAGAFGKSAQKFFGGGPKTLATSGTQTPTGATPPTPPAGSGYWNYEGVTPPSPAGPTQRPIVPQAEPTRRPGFVQPRPPEPPGPATPVKAPPGPGTSPTGKAGAGAVKPAATTEQVVPGATVKAKGKAKGTGK